MEQRDLAKKEAASKKGRASRVKGAVYENTIAKILRVWAAPAIKETEDPADLFVRTPRSGAWHRKLTQAEDLSVPAWFPFVIECKSRNKSSWSWKSFLLDGEPLLTWLKETEVKHEGKNILLIFTQPYAGDWVLARPTGFTIQQMKSFHILNYGGEPFVLCPLPSLLALLDPKQMRFGDSEDGKSQEHSN